MKLRQYIISNDIEFWKLRFTDNNIMSTEVFWKRSNCFLNPDFLIYPMRTHICNESLTHYKFYNFVFVWLVTYRNIAQLQFTLLSQVYKHQNLRGTVTSIGWSDMERPNNESWSIFSPQWYKIWITNKVLFLLQICHSTIKKLQWLLVSH